MRAPKNTNRIVLDLSMGVNSLKEIQTVTAEAIKKGALAGMGARTMALMTTNMKRAQDKIQQSMIKVEALDQKRQLTSITKQEKKRLDTEAHVARRRLLAEKKQFQQEIDDIEAVADRMGKTGKWSEAGEKLGEGMGEAFSSAMSLSLPALLKQLGGAAKEAGLGASARAAGGEGAGAKALGGLGTVLTKIGPALMAVGAIAAGFAAIVKIIIDSDAAAKELNRAVLDGGVGVGDLADKYGDVDLSVRAVTSSFATAWKLNRKWGTTAKDHLEILGGYAEAGLTMKEIARGTQSAAEAMEKYQAATETAMVYSKIFGTGAKEMAEHMGSWMEDLGGDLTNVANSLAAIHIAAKDSGFSTKRFFGLLQTATSGMSMYNVRLSEAAGLLVKLGKVLGVKKGAEMMGGLTGGFADLGMQERYKKVVLTGGKMKGLLGGSAQARATDLLGVKGAKEALGGTGLEGMGPEEMVRALGKMGAQQQADLLSTLRGKGAEDLANQMREVAKASTAAAGGTGAQAAGLGSLTMGGKLAAQLFSTRGIPGLATSIYQMTDQQRMGFEQLTGISGEQFEQLKNLSQNIEGGWANISAAIQKNSLKGTPLENMSPEAMAKAYGVVVQEENGKLVARQARVDETTGKVGPLGKVITNLDEHIMGQGDVFDKAAKEGRPIDTRLAEQTAMATTEMTKILEQGVEYWLIQINRGVEGIFNWLPGREKDREARQKAVDTQAKIVQESSDKARDLGKDINKWKTEMMSATTPEEKAKLGAKIEEAEAQQEIWVKQGAEAQEKRGYLNRGGTVQEAGVLALKEKGVTDPFQVRAEEIARQRVLDSLMAEGEGEKSRQIKKEMIAGRPVEVTKEDLEKTTAEWLKKGVDPKSPLGMKKQKAEETSTLMTDKLLVTDLVKKIQEQEDKRTEDIIAATLMGGDMDPAQAARWANVLGPGGTGGELPEGMPPQVKALMKEHPEWLNISAASQRGWAQAHDWVARGGPGGVSASRIDSADVVTAAKPGGALSKAGVGGGKAVTNVYHLYNDGPGVMAAIKRAQAAGMLA